MNKLAILSAIFVLALAACRDKEPKVIVWPPQPQPPPYVPPPPVPPDPPQPQPAPVVVPMPPQPPDPPPVNPGSGIQPIAPVPCNGTAVGPDGWVSACGGATVGGAPSAAILDVPAQLPGLGTVIRANAWGPLLGRTMVMRYSVSGDCQLQAKGDGKYDPGEPMLTLYIQSSPQLSNDEDNRWYAGKARGKLTENGSYEMRASVTPDQWSNVMGHGGVGREGQFQASVNAAPYIGFVAGGGYFAHQVWCTAGTGTKRVVVTDFHIE